MADLIDFGALTLADEVTWYGHERRPEEAQRAFLTFGVAGEDYGIELVRLREIIKARPPTEVPRAPPFVAGVIAVRGLVMPVLDLGIRLGLPARPQPPTRCLVVARNEERFGLLVDQVHQVVSFTESQIEATPATLLRTESMEGRGGGGARPSEFVAGIGRVPEAPDRLIILLDLDAVLRFEVRRRRGDTSS